MSNKFFAGLVDPWPFKLMEVGDVAICISEYTPKRAHAYGSAVGKRFTVKKTKSKSGQSGFMVTRLPDETPVRKSTGKPRGRPRKVWPFEMLELGQSYTNTDPYEIPKIINSANHANQIHRRMRKRPTYSVRTFRNFEQIYTRVVVTRIY